MRELEQIETVNKEIWDQQRIEKLLQEGMRTLNNLLQSDVPSARRALKSLLGSAIRCKPVIRDGKKTLALEGETKLGSFLPPSYINVASPRGFEPLLPP